MPKSVSEAVSLLTNLDPYTLSVAALSLKIAIASLLIAMLIAIPLGLFLGLRKFAGRLGIMILVNAAMGLPPVVAGLLTFMALRREGVFGNANLLYTPTAMVIAQIPLVSPVIAGVIMAATATVPRSLRLQARALGASRLQEAWVVVREIRTSLLAACIAGFGAAISEVGALLITGGNLLVGGKNYTRTLTTAIVLETRLGNFARALAFALVLLFAIVLVNVMLTRSQIGRRTE